MRDNALEHNRDWFEKNAKGRWNDDVAAAYEAATYALLKDQDQADALITGFQSAKSQAPLGRGRKSTTTTIWAAPRSTSISLRAISRPPQDGDSAKTT